ncbi:T9SS type A sorting domain-containing protein [Polaribacter sp. Q13]|uniref:T9SS type A sorting domain-containing protein n=1 Tax=Polaribacter sp. Q13 TaxID=2806551 RepID=UPI00193BB856|nr:T9SS type A sorting domain-containing protein [Polaribacter sp. Q13]QVY65988.1 T9SS type A sorting domain-containing protein [Polaribacter sp. Q13]
MSKIIFKTSLFLAVILFQLNLYAKRIKYTGDKDYTAIVNNAITTNTLIEFDANKVYTFNGKINTRAGVRIIFQTRGSNSTVRGGATTNATLQYIGGNTGTFINLLGSATFNQIIIDGGGNKYGGNTRSFIISTNQQPKTIFTFVTLKNSDGSGIGQKGGLYANGLTIKDSKFLNIAGQVINLFDRRSMKTNNVVITRIDNPILIERSTFSGTYGSAIYVDNGNDFRKNIKEREPHNKGFLRNDQPTDMNLILRDNKFKQADRWNISLNQASNVLIEGNTFEGPKTTNKNNTTMHIEQIVRNIRIIDNIFNIDKGHSIIDVSAREGLKRLQDENWPLLIEEHGSSSVPVQAQASNAQLNADFDVTDISKIKNKRGVHAYGARNWTIKGNKFNAIGTGMKFAMDLVDAENVNFKNNTFTGNFENKIIIDRGEQGNKNITINGVNTCDIKFNGGEPWLKKGLAPNGTVTNADRTSANIKIGGSLLTTIINCAQKTGVTLGKVTVESKVNNFSFYPNPASNSINITTGAGKHAAKIYDVNGRVVKVFNLEENTTSLISLKNLDAGFYIMKSKNLLNNTTNTNRLIIK